MEIELNGEMLMALPSGALFWPRQSMLVVSDLHFEKGSNFAARGVLLPPYDTRQTLDRLASAIEATRPETILSLGDAFHDVEAEARMDPRDFERLQDLTSGRRWIWVLGNHDPAPPARLGGEVEHSLRAGPLVFRHEPGNAREPGEIAGHLHPAARVIAQSRTIRRRCFASDGEKLVMPAFGAYAGGLNVLDSAFGRVMSASLVAYVVGQEGVYPFFGPALLPDRNGPVASRFTA